jgi:hypothetical protein
MKRVYVILIASHLEGARDICEDMQSGIYSSDKEIRETVQQQVSNLNPDSEQGDDEVQILNHVDFATAFNNEMVADNYWYLATAFSKN